MALKYARIAPNIWDLVGQQIFCFKARNSPIPKLHVELTESAGITKPPTQSSNIRAHQLVLHFSSLSTSRLQFFFQLTMKTWSLNYVGVHSHCSKQRLPYDSSVANQVPAHCMYFHKWPGRGTNLQVYVALVKSNTQVHLLLTRIVHMYMYHSYYKNLFQIWCLNPVPQMHRGTLYPANLVHKAFQTKW